MTRDHWKVSIDGQHVPDNILIRSPLKPHKMSEVVNDNILKKRLANTCPMAVFRHQLGKLDGPLIYSLNNTTTLMNLVCRHSFGMLSTAMISGMDSSHQLTSGSGLQAKKDGHVLLYQQGNLMAAVCDSDRPWILCLNNQSALKAAQVNQFVLGLNGKHGLQNDGVILQSETTRKVQHLPFCS